MGNTDITLKAFDRFVINDHTVTRRKARLPKACDVCRGQIVKGEHYFELTLNGAGVGGFIKPARVHEEHLLGYFK